MEEEKEKGIQDEREREGVLSTVSISANFAHRSLK